MHLSPDLIYDVGAHKGEDTAFYLKKGFRVVAIEANPMLAEQCVKRFRRHIGKGRLHVLNLAVTADAGQLPFYVNNENTAWSSLDRDLGERDGGAAVAMVRAAPLSAALAIFGVPHYLKIDIEGADYDALTSLDTVSELPRYVSVENGNGGLLDYLVDRGYSSFKFINQQLVPRQTPPRPAREGTYTKWKFPFGASGLFGEETPGDWKTSAEVKDQIDTYWAIPDRDANRDGWFDLHARLTP